MQLTKRRMDEAEQLLQRLEKRSATTTSTAEKRAIDVKIGVLRDQYAGFVAEMQIGQES